MSEKSKGPAATGPQPKQLTSSTTVPAQPDSVQRFRAVATDEPGVYEAVEVPDTPEPVPVAAHPLDDTRAFIRRYVVLTDEQADAIALWVLHTHAHDALGTTPYLAITSPEKRSGKTLLLETLELLVREPVLSGSISGASLARIVDARQPTLLLDESDAAFVGNGEYAEVLRGVLNTGFRSSGRLISKSRAVERQALPPNPAGPPIAAIPEDESR
jgi:hypothetical protein